MQAVFVDLTEQLKVALDPFPVQFDNQDGFIPPDNAPWARVAYLLGASVRATLGDTCSHDTFVAIAQIELRIPKGTGVLTAYDKADALKKRFHNAGIGTAFVQSIDYFRVGEEGPWFQLNVDLNLLVNQEL